MVLTALATTVILSLSAQGVVTSTSNNSNNANGANRTAAAAPARGTKTAVYPAFGDASPDVVRLQQAMVVRGFTLRGGVDGVFSARTRSTLRNLQQAVGLRPTGVVDEPTARFLGLLAVARLTPETLPKPGDTGEGVWSLQQALINAGVEVKGGADGEFGVATTVALASYQSRQRLSVTRTLDHATAFALGLVDVAPPKPVVAAPVVARPSTPVATPTPTPAAAAAPAPAVASGEISINSLPRRGERSEAVRTVQQTLINLGIEVKGGADGVFGVATAIALGNFQASRGLHQSQSLDFPTAQAMGLIPSLESLGIPTIKVFPVQGRCSFTNTWQEDRGGRRHEGVDIIAPRGNLIYAVMDGVITKMYTNAALSGNALRLTTSDGTYFFYAHLDTFAPGIAVGSRVVAGQILGTNGSTGNTTTPHLHFEVHPRGGAAIDPTPIVAAVNGCHITEPLPQP